MKAVQSFYESFLSYHPEEAARILESFSFMEILRLMSQTTSRNVARLISSMTPALAVELLRALPDGMLHSTMPEFPHPVLASLMTRMTSEEREQFQRRIPSSVVKELSLYMDFPAETAGSLMDPRVIALPEDWTVGQAIEQIRTNSSNEVYEIYVIDREQGLVGTVSLRELLIRPLDDRLKAVMDRDLLAIHPLELREQILEIFNQGKVLRIPVVDLDGHLLGVIRNRAIVKASQEDATADMQTMVGASADERALSPSWFAVRKRLPWLQINLLTAFAAACVVGLFENTISQFTALAVLLPVVAGQSGNTGAQSLAVVMRGLALRDIRPSQWFIVSSKEVTVAFLNGLAVAATTCAGVYIWSGSTGLTMVMGISMLASMTIAGMSGAIIPMILRAMKQDPAQASSIILTTVTDVVGFLSFLGLATLFSSWLG